MAFLILYDRFSVLKSIFYLSLFLEVNNGGSNAVSMKSKEDVMIRFCSRSQVFFKIDVLKNFANFTGKHLCRCLFLLKF